MYIAALGIGITVVICGFVQRLMADKGRDREEIGRLQSQVDQLLREKDKHALDNMFSNGSKYTNTLDSLR